MMRMRNLGVRWAAAVAVCCVVAACSGQTAPTASPTAAVLGSSSEPSTAPPLSAAAGWVPARVEQPVDIEGVPTNAPGFCSPCHPVTGTYIQTIVATPSGFLAMGSEQPPSRAAAWSSTDSATWQRLGNVPGSDGSNISAAVATAGGVVAVGSSGSDAAVWRTVDGTAWTLVAPPAPSAGMTEQLSAIAAVGAASASGAASGGFVAAGYTQDGKAVKRASFWRSSDGVNWSRVGAPDGAAPTEVTGLASSGTVVVAVGISGDERRGSSAVWRSTDGGATWSRVSSGSFGSGRMLSVAFAGGTFAAVGENVVQTAAAAWTSPDGSTWTAAPAQAALSNDGEQMVMMAVAPNPAGGFVADGWKSDAGNGSAVVWRSADGGSWTRLPQDVTFSGAGMAAILATPRLLAAGTMGWPDTHAAQVWIAPGS